MVSRAIEIETTGIENMMNIKPSNRVSRLFVSNSGLIGSGKV